MPRTRNFLLFLLGGFCVIAGMTVYAAPHMRMAAAIPSGWSASIDTPEPTYTAFVPGTSDDRAARLADLRAKLADRTVLAAPEPAVETKPATTTKPATGAATTTVAELQTCSGYATYTGVWTPQQITMSEREGVRLYTETVPASDAGPASELVRARIAQRTWPLGTPSCLPNDIVGIATDGSLIRATDVRLYTVFSGTTEIGYSLDGYPMYGVTPGVTLDACGGAMVAGAYRYIIDPKRPTVISCFSGIPASIE